MITKRLRKRRKGAHRLDLTGLKEALKDRRCWTCLATPVIRDGESEHWSLELDDVDGSLVDILVTVETQPDGQELTCRLGGMSSVGALTIPALGDEVLVCVPAGRIDFAPTIVAILSSNDLPNPAGQGPELARTLIVNSEVMVHDGVGGAVPLALKSDVQAIRDDLDGHSHTYIPGTNPVAQTTLNPSVTAPTGTTVLKAK